MRNWRYHVFTLIWAVIIAILTLSPGRSMPDSPFRNIPYLDKIVHAGIFALLSFLMARGIIKQYSGHKTKYACFAGFTITISYGAAIEYLQKLVPGRSFELNDLIANTTGALLGIAACYFLLKLTSNRS